MWRDILIVAGFVFAFLMYFGLTPRQLSTYAKTAKGEIAQRSRFQKAILSFVIAATPLCIFAIVRTFNNATLVQSLLMIMILIFIWDTVLTDSWKLKLPQTAEKVVNLLLRPLASLAFFSLMVTNIVLSDSLLWQKVVYPLIGFAIGASLRLLPNYIHKKRHGRSSSKGPDKSPPVPLPKE